VGRDPGCAVSIRERDVSRVHAWLTMETSEVVRIENPGAKNGIRVRGRRLPEGDSMALRIGDIVELADALLVFCGEETPIARAAPDATPRPRAGSSELDRFVAAVARADIGILIVGERGVGKTFLAESLHARSARAVGPYATVDCRVPGETVLLQELFEGGGAVGAALGGTLILDEVGELPLAIQDRLVAVDGDLRWIATTRHDLVRSVAAGTFRRELYDRLGGVRVLLASLAERRGEIPRLAARFVANAAAREGRTPPRISTEALAILVRHPFPGNLQELRETMERALRLAGPRFIGPEHIVLDPPRPPPDTPRFLPARTIEPTEIPDTLVETVEIPRAPPTPRLDDERARIQRTLEVCGGNATKAAAALGISRQKLAARMKDLGIGRPKK